MSDDLVGKFEVVTAYDQAQDLIMGEVRAAHSRVANAHTRINEHDVRFNSFETGIVARLDAALRRVEQLELEVAQLSGPREPVPLAPHTHLPCGCWNDVRGCRGHAPPCAPVPEVLPDEGT